MNIWGKVLVGLLAIAALRNKKGPNDDEEDSVGRTYTPCDFTEGVSELELEAIVKHVAKGINRITDISVSGAIVYGTVQAKSGLSIWHFKVDYNDYGSITGKYWIDSENDDSRIPEVLAERVSYLLMEKLSEYEEAGNDTRVYTDSDFNYKGNETRTFDEKLRSNLEKMKEQAERFNTREQEKTGGVKRYLILIAVFGLVCSGLFIRHEYGEYQKRIEVGIASAATVGKKYEQIVNILEKNGFTNVQSVPRADLEYKDRSKENLVAQVIIHGKNKFEETAKFSYDSRVEVIYHTLKEIKIPVSAKAARKMNYEELEEKLREAGFVNIKTEADYDLITGWITKDGMVESISVNGDTSFKDDASYRPDVPVVISYHTFSKEQDK